jgi:hypothetical protein
VETDTATPTPTSTPKDPDADTDGDTIANSADLDDDNDGCTDELELGENEGNGGLRDPHHFWDFFDVPAGNPRARDARVTIVDLTQVVQRFGSVGDGSGDPFSAPPAAPEYHPAYDRSPGPAGSDPWDTGPPNGSVTITDVTLLVQQFGHTCAF